jgi:hypothetical protein
VAAAAAATHSHKFSKLIFLSARHVSHSTFVIISTLARAADERAGLVGFGARAHLDTLFAFVANPQVWWRRLSSFAKKFVSAPEEMLLQQFP